MDGIAPTAAARDLRKRVQAHTGRRAPPRECFRLWGRGRRQLGGGAPHSSHQQAVQRSTPRAARWATTRSMPADLRHARAQCMTACVAVSPVPCVRRSRSLYTPSAKTPAACGVRSMACRSTLPSHMWSTRGSISGVAPAALAGAGPSITAASRRPDGDRRVEKTSGSGDGGAANAVPRRRRVRSGHPAGVSVKVLLAKSRGRVEPAQTRTMRGGERDGGCHFALGQRRQISLRRRDGDLREACGRGTVCAAAS